MFVLLLRVFTHIRLRILATSLSVYICGFVQGMYTCKTGNLGNEPLCFCLCLFRNYMSVIKFNCMCTCLLFNPFLVSIKDIVYSPIIFLMHLFLLFIHHKMNIPSLLKFIPHDMFLIKRTNKLTGVDKFASEIGYTINVMGVWVLIQPIVFLCSQADHLYVILHII